MIELDLKSPLVSEEALDNFATELRSRKALRQSKERHEKRFHRKQQKKEKRNNQSTVIVPSGQNDAVRPAAPQQNRQTERPTPDGEFHPDRGDAIMAGGQDQLTSSLFPEINAKPEKAPPPSQQDPSTTTATADDDQVTSFAEMLRCGKTKPQAVVKAWPDLAPTRSVGIPVPLKKAGDDARPWGSKAGKEDVSNNNNNKEAVVPEGGEAEEECFAPAFKESFSDALSKAFDQLGVEDAKPPEKTGEEKEGGVGAEVEGGKKKKKKPKLLFSTSMQPRMK